ncbi:MAG: AAA family ATPase [Victivallales bacterium]|nr:AAA family ATPase [Victivallales bacterium]
MSKVCPDPLAVAAVLKQIFSPGDVFEIRALEASVQGNRRPHTEIGYFDYDHIDCMGQELNRFLFAKGIYYTPNPVMPELLARAANRMKDAGRDPSTKDTEILIRRWLLIDCDPVRPSGISSTDAEHELAHTMAKKIRDGMASINWSKPIYCDSGNGAQLMYRIDLPINDNDLVKRVLASLAMLNDGKVEVDQSVCNPSRLWRLPGTLNCRGDHTADRPHRLASIIDMPDTLGIVTIEQLEQVAANAKAKSKQTVDLSAIAGAAPIRSSTFNIDDWISRYCPDIQGPSDWQGGRKWIFPVCPFNESHNNKSAVLIEQASGAIAFKCHHNGCRDYGWKELRELKEPPKPQPAAQPVRVDAVPVKAHATHQPPDDIEAKPLSELFEKVTELDPPLIHGLLREGETMNVIASSKMGKSWLVMRLAISIASGLDWFGMPVEYGKVLHIDNELRLKTLVYRYRKVAEALKVPYNLFSHNLEVKSLRGHLQDLDTLGRFFATISPGKYKAIIIDAFYRTLPEETDENNNAAISNLYNRLDSYASRIQCAFILIHHSSKGNQSQKSITDVGAGAGAQSRAADTHLILRPHEMKNVAVLEAAVRSWPPREPMCLRWEFPLWYPASELDPYALQGKPQSSTNVKHTWTIEEFIEKCVKPFDPCSQKKVIYEAEQLGMSERKTRSMIELAQSEGQLAKEQDGTNTHLVAVRPGIAEGTAQIIAARLSKNPDQSIEELAEEFGVGDRYIRKIRQAALNEPDDQ